MAAVTPGCSWLLLLGCLLGAVLRKSIKPNLLCPSPTSPGDTAPNSTTEWKYSVPSAVHDISLPAEIALELSLFCITGTFCVSYTAICFPDKARCLCVLGFLAKGHGDTDGFSVPSGQIKRSLFLCFGQSLLSPSRRSEIKTYQCCYSVFMLLVFSPLFSCGLFPSSLRGVGVKYTSCL